MKRVLGIGNALVDVLVKIDRDRILSKLGLVKGSMTLIDREKMKFILEEVGSMHKKRSSGGSAANTIYGVAKLGILTGFIGKIGKDEYGDFFDSDMKSNKIKTNLFKGEEKTGRVIVFISKDAERTFATFLGSAVELSYSDLDCEFFEGYNYFHLDGYLIPNQELVKKALQLAKETESEISIDLANFNVVKNNRDFLEFIIKNYVDIVFANEEEAKAFTGKENPEDAMIEISKECKISVVKLGKNGSLIKDKKNQYKIAPIEANSIDTTGAGDLYASGFFYGLINGYPLEICGKIASIVAGKVVEVIGAKMNEDKWREVKDLISGAIV